MSCNCCELDCEAPDVLAESTGFNLAEGNFTPGNWAAIPDGYKAMKWLKYIVENVEGTYQYRTYCGDTPPDWITNVEVTKTGVFYEGEYDPLEDYTLTWTAGGTETDVKQERPDACDDPPDFTYSLNDQWTGEWEYRDGGAKLDYAGTDKDSNPISGTLISHGYFGLLTAALTTDSALALADASVIQTTTRDWDGVILTAENPDAHYTGGDETQHGYEDLSPITVTITPPAVRFQQIKYKLVFIHWDTEAETVIEEDEWLFHTGDDPKEITFTPAHPGTLKLTARYRCSRKTPFKKLIAVP